MGPSGSRGESYGWEELGFFKSLCFVVGSVGTDWSGKGELWEVVLPPPLQASTLPSAASPITVHSLSVLRRSPQPDHEHPWSRRCVRFTSFCLTMWPSMGPDTWKFLKELLVEWTNKWMLSPNYAELWMGFTKQEKPDCSSQLLTLLTLDSRRQWAPKVWFLCLCAFSWGIWCYILLDFWRGACPPKRIRIIIWENSSGMETWYTCSQHWLPWIKSLFFTTLLFSSCV